MAVPNYKQGTSRERSAGYGFANAPQPNIRSLPDIGRANYHAPAGSFRPLSRVKAGSHAARLLRRLRVLFNGGSVIGGPSGSMLTAIARRYSTRTVWRVDVDWRGREVKPPKYYDPYLR
jgi:hypothetical protein